MCSQSLYFKHQMGMLGSKMRLPLIYKLFSIPIGVPRSGDRCMAMAASVVIKNGSMHHQ